MTKNEFMELSSLKKTEVMFDWLNNKPKNESSKIAKEALHLYSTKGCSMIAALYVLYVTELE